MTPKKPENTPEFDLFRNKLSNMLDQRHALYKLAALINWPSLEDEFGSLYCDHNGAPGKSIRLMIGLEYLKQMYDLSDDKVVARWVENPYWQYLCGETYFQYDMPIEPSSLSRFRQRIGKSGGETLLAESIQAGLKSRTVKTRDFKRVTVDTTVQEKAVTFPTDSKLLNRSRVRLVKLCQHKQMTLRQTYARKGPQAVWKASRYAHAKQMRRMRRQVKTLRTYLGRVVRDIERQIVNDPDRQRDFANELAMAKRLLAQKKHSTGKLYSLHAPEVECISKGKAHKRYEFGIKVSITSTNKSNFIVGAQSLPGSPYDGHTLQDALAQTRRLTHTEIDEAFVDKGYRGHDEQTTQVYLSGQRRGIQTRSLRKRLKRRQAIEPIIGHLKSDGRLGRNYLQGVLGDAMNVLLCCAGYNLRLILRHLRIFWLSIWRLCTAVLGSNTKQTVDKTLWLPLAINRVIRSSTLIA